MIVIARLKAKSGEESKMVDALREMISKVAKEDGTLVYTLHQAKNDPKQFLFYEKYVDADAFKAHSSTSYFKELSGILAPLLDGAPEIEMYTEIARIEK